jgi:hypothetical protein
MQIKAARVGMVHRVIHLGVRQLQLVRMSAELIIIRAAGVEVLITPLIQTREFHLSVVMAAAEQVAAILMGNLELREL